MKRLGQVVALVAILGAAAALVAWNALDLVVKWGLEHYGPDITGVAVKVQRVEISPLDGRGSIRGLEIGTPAGFSAPRAARLGEVRVAVDPRTVASAVVHVHEFSIEQPQLVFERGDKQSNLDAIQAHIEAYVKKNVPVDEVRPGGDRTSGARRYRIDRIAIRGARVTMTTRGLRGQGLEFDLPDVELRNLGKDRGVTAGEAAAAVASVLQNRIAQKLLTNAELLRHGGVEGAIDALKGLLK